MLFISNEGDARKIYASGGSEPHKFKFSSPRKSRTNYQGQKFKENVPKRKQVRFRAFRVCSKWIMKIQENWFWFELAQGAREENKYPKYEDWRAKTPQRGSSMLAFVKFCTRLKVMIGFDAILL